MVLNVHRSHKAYYGRGRGGKCVWSWWEEGDYNYTYRYTVTTKMTPALRWAAMTDVLMFH